MKVLICGATGFIGRNLVERLSQELDLEIFALRHVKSKYVIKNVRWLTADLRNPDDVRRLLSGKDVVIQAAATTTGIRDMVSRPYLHVTDNAIMNSVVFREAHHCGVKHIIFFSCTTMYQPGSKPLREDDFDPRVAISNIYFGVAHTKLYIENMCRFFSNIGPTKFTVIRHSNVYGPHDKFDLDRSHVFGATITKVMTEDQDIVVWGNGKEKRDLMYIQDLVDFVLLAIQKQTKKFELINCGSSRLVSINELVRRIIDISGRGLRIKHDLERPTTSNSISIDCTRIQETYGWSPKVELDDGIRCTIDWWKENYS